MSDRTSVQASDHYICVFLQVLYVENLTAENRVERELVLIKVRAPPGEARTQIRELAQIFRARILDASGPLPLRQAVPPVLQPQGCHQRGVDCMGCHGYCDTASNWFQASQPAT